MWKNNSGKGGEKMLVQKNILKSTNDKTYDVFTNYITNDFINDTSLPFGMLPSDYVTECWRRYIDNASASTYTRNNALNGKVFEVIVATALYRRKVIPFYFQAAASLIPDVDYDIIMFDKENEIPITISMKTSSRERYKQADLEAYAFSNVYRSALNYLIMLNERDCRTVQRKIDAGAMLGLEKVIRANSSDFDSFVDELSKRKLGRAPRITLFDGQLIRK